MKLILSRASQSYNIEECDTAPFFFFKDLLHREYIYSVYKDKLQNCSCIQFEKYLHYGTSGMNYMYINICAHLELDRSVRHSSASSKLTRARHIGIK